MTKLISLTQGKVTQVSDHRFDYLSRWKWRAQLAHGKWYAVSIEGKRPFRKRIYMHRVILGITDPKIEVDHFDGDGLNNRDENLRASTTSQNQHNRGKPRTNTSGFKGVTWHKAKRKYQASITVKGKDIFLGLFNDPIEAAKAYDAAALKHLGEFAGTNFGPCPVHGEPPKAK